MHLVTFIRYIIFFAQIQAIAQSFGEPTPYRLKVDGWVMGPNNYEDMSSDGHNGVAVENLEVLPRCLTPLDDGVWMLPSG